MSLGIGSPVVNEKEAGVFLAKGCKVPPNLVMRVGAQLSESMAGEYIVKAATKGELLIPRTLHNGGDNPVLCLINISDHYVQHAQRVLARNHLGRCFFAVKCHKITVKCR